MLLLFLQGGRHYFGSGFDLSRLSFLLQNILEIILSSISRRKTFAKSLFFSKQWIRLFLKNTLTRFHLKECVLPTIRYIQNGILLDKIC